MSERWDTADIARYLGLKRDYVTDKVIKRDGFPAPVINRGPKLRRWLAQDVVRWAAGDQSLAAMSADEVR